MKLSKIKVYTAMLTTGINQTILAKNARISRTNLSSIVNGKSCRTDTALKIAKALGVDVTELLED